MEDQSRVYTASEPPQSVWPANAFRNNSTGSDVELLNRLKIREICEGWGMYRDAAEWDNFRSMWHPGAYVTISWMQGSIEDFIKRSGRGFVNQPPHGNTPHVVHRIQGQTIDVQGCRAISKMKVRISCRMVIDGVEVDVDSDTRFFYFLEKRERRWGGIYMTLLFEKDSMSPVNPGTEVNISEDELSGYPSGYKYLCWMEDRAGVSPKLDLNAYGPERDILY